MLGSFKGLIKQPGNSDACDFSLHSPHQRPKQPQGFESLWAETNDCAESVLSIWPPALTLNVTVGA